VSRPAYSDADADTKDYCPSEHFNVTCPPTDVILMEHAQYGRMRSGRCVSGHHGVIGCAVDVLTFFDRKCSGRTHCTVYVADPALQKLEPCSKDFTSYLEAKYTCLSGNDDIKLVFGRLCFLRCLLRRVFVILFLVMFCLSFWATTCIYFLLQCK